MRTEPSPPPADGPKTGHIDSFESRRLEGGTLDRVVAEMAERQHGVVSLPQLRDVGLSGAAVQKRVARGRLHKVHRGVYAVGHGLLGPDGRRMAAVLGCGSGAVLSHRSAAVLWGLKPEDPDLVDVTAPNRRGRIPTGIKAHRDGSLQTPDRTSFRGIPCTTVARTLLDLAAVVSVSELRRAISEAEFLRIFDSVAVRATIKRSRGRRGVARLRMLVDELDPQTKRTRSELERQFLAMCSKAAIPTPAVNCELDLGSVRLTPDFIWSDARLVVETDGRVAHDTGSAFERDRRRDQILSAAGWRVIRCTWRQVLDEPLRLTQTLRALLASPGAPERRWA